VLGDVDEAISTFVILLSVVSSSASLGYWLARQFGKIDARFQRIEMKIDGIEMRLDRLEKGIYGFNELLLKRALVFQASKPGFDLCAYASR
jgi:urea transporter